MDSINVNKNLIDIELRILKNHEITRGNYFRINGSANLREEIRGWLYAQGIKPDKVRKAQDETLEKAYTNENYLWKMRFDIKSGKRDDVRPLDVDIEENSAPLEAWNGAKRPQVPADIFDEPPLPSPIPEDKLITVDTEQRAKAADTVISARLNAAKAELARSLDQKFDSWKKDVKISLSDDAKQAIKDLAKLTAEEVIKSQQVSRIEIYNRETQTTVDMGIQHYLFPKLLKLMQIRTKDGYHPNIWLTGPTGSGKTQAVENAAKSLGYEFGADSSLDADYKVLGHEDASGNFHMTVFLERFSKGGVYDADEIDNWNPSALVALNSAMAQGWVFTCGKRFDRHKDFMIVACANTWGYGATNDYVGRSKLDAATVNRFSPRLDWPYDEKMELAIASANQGTDWCKLVQSFRAKAKAQGLHVIISPRDTFSGMMLLNEGFSQSDVIDMTFAAGLKPEQRNSLGIDQIKATDTTDNHFPQDKNIRYEDFRTAIENNQTISAIKFLRARMGWDLVKAKTYVDDIKDFKKPMPGHVTWIEGAFL